ncbi:MAG: tetratricopeptide repeat protein, partial [Acidobacteria bacterium]|nr:tetratricopeptide repeat protein [Acidobacteriota bacterium]
MKRCPECRRDYYDDSLLYCLDDGSTLLEGPGSGGESQTAILHETAPPGEAVTKAQIHTTEQTAVLPSGFSDMPKARGLNKWLLLMPLALAVIALCVFFGYRYVTQAKQINSIAVLPFINESGNADVEYLSDGMTESLIRGLSQLPGLSVKARSSVFRYKGKDIDAQSIGKELGVQALLIGRLVGGRGDQLHLNLELVDAQTENVIWTDDYDRKPAELVSLLTVITHDVSTRIRPSSNQDGFAKPYTDNSEAYQLYLQGRFFWNKRTLDGFQQAIGFFQKALALDPNYALAHTGLADSYALIAIYEGAYPKDVMPRAKQEALTALSLDPNLAEAHASLGQVLQNYDFDFAGAEKEYKKAIELNPNYASAHQWYGELLANLGRFNEALSSIDRALALDPFSLVIHRMKGSILSYARRPDEALQEMTKLVAMDPNFPGVHYDLYVLYELKGDHEKSVQEYAKQRELIGDAVGAERARKSFASGGWRGFLLDRVTNNEDYARFHHFHLAAFHLALGDKDRAM